MDFVLQNWMLIAVAFVSGGMLIWPLVSRGAGGSGSVDPNRAVQMINRDKATVIDVSEADEFASGHVVGSRNVPVAGVESGSAGLPSNKATPLILVCPTGGRAGRAAATLRNKGFQSVHVLAGGLNAWRAAGLPLEKGAQAQEQAATKQVAGKSSKSASKAGGKTAGKAAAKAATATAAGAAAGASAKSASSAQAVASEADVAVSDPGDALETGVTAEESDASAALEETTQTNTPQADAVPDTAQTDEEGRGERPPAP